MPPGERKELFVVVTLTIIGIGDVPFTVTGVVAGAHEACEGAPEHVMVTAPVKPPTWFTCRLYIAEFPGVTVADNEPPLATPNEKSGWALKILVTKASLAPDKLD